MNNKITAQEIIDILRDENPDITHREMVYVLEDGEALGAMGLPDDAEDAIDEAYYDILMPKLRMVEMSMTEDKLRALTDATGGDVYDINYLQHQHQRPENGAWMYHAVETFETLEMFLDSSKGWAERSKVQSGEIAGLPFVCWESMQVKKGQQRGSLSVIDFGAVRVAVSCNISDYV